MTQVLGDGESMNPVDVAEGVEPTKAIAGRTPWQLARARLRRDKVTMFFLLVVGLAVVLGIVGPILDKLGVIDPMSYNANLIDANTGGLPKGSWDGMSWSHPLGVEPGTGRDVMARIWIGMTFSLVISFLATVVSVGIGTIVGLVSGFLGKAADFWLSRLIDLVLAFPQTLMLIALSGVFTARITGLGVPSGNPSNFVYIVLVMGLFGWPTFARIVRGQVLSLREREFIEAAKSLGASNRRIYFKELLPNLWAPLLVYFTLLMPSFISAEAALSYLNVGIKPPTPTLGNVLTDSVTYASADFIFFFAPAFAIAVLVLSLNLVGDGLRDALDPKAGR